MTKTAFSKAQSKDKNLNYSYHPKSWYEQLYFIVSAK